MKSYRNGIFAIAISLSTLGTLGCATKQYQYIADNKGLEQFTSNEGATYSIPSDEVKKGELKVMAYGVTHLTPNRDLSNVPAMHIRMIVTNNSAHHSWVLNPTDQLLEIPPKGASEPAYIDEDGKLSESTRITIHPGKKKVVDLYYPLTGDTTDPTKIPHFSILWRIHANDKVVNNVATFERFSTSQPLKTAQTSLRCMDEPYTLGCEPNPFYEASG